MNPTQRSKLTEMRALYRIHRYLAHGGDQTTLFFCHTCAGHLRRIAHLRSNGARENIRLALFPNQPDEQPGLPLARPASSA